jgi:hypothetical protein
MRIGAIAVVAVLLGGCVSINHADNYRPASDSRARDYYECFQNAHQPVAASSFGANRYAASGYAAAGMKLNAEMLESCMQARGYRLRSPSTPETVIGIATSPIWIPLGILGGGFGPTKIGGGGGGE